MATLVYGAVQTLVTTALQSLASSATAGWQSAQVDNTGTIYIDALVQVVLDFANTAPANDKVAYVYVAGGLTTGVLSNPASGVEGAITLLDVTANAQNLRLLGVIPYTTADEVAESSPMSVANAFGGVMPNFWSVIVVDYSGAALAAAGSTVKYVGVTVA